MNLDELKQILELVREHEIAELELEQDGVRLRLARASAAPAAATPPALTMPAPHPSMSPPAAVVPVSSASSTPQPSSGDELEGVDLAVVKSPIVGTFYRSAEPGAGPFVEVGQPVKKRQVLCIIEAMKLMNEIESEYDGEVVKVYVENGQPVQYGERLFAIKVH